MGLLSDKPPSPPDPVKVSFFFCPGEQAPPYDNFPLLDNTGNPAVFLLGLMSSGPPLPFGATLPFSTESPFHAPCGWRLFFKVRSFLLAMEPGSFPFFFRATRYVCVYPFSGRGRQLRRTTFLFSLYKRRRLPFSVQTSLGGTRLFFPFLLAAPAR